MNEIKFNDETIKNTRGYLSQIYELLINKKTDSFYNEEFLKMCYGCAEELSQESNKEVAIDDNAILTLTDAKSLKQVFIVGFNRSVYKMVTMLTGDEKYAKAKETIHSNFLELSIEAINNLDKNNGVVLKFPYLDKNNKLWEFTYNNEKGVYTVQPVDTEIFKKKI